MPKHQPTANHSQPHATSTTHPHLSRQQLNPPKSKRKKTPQNARPPTIRLAQTNSRRRATCPALSRPPRWTRERVNAPLEPNCRREQSRYVLHSHTADIFFIYGSSPPSLFCLYSSALCRLKASRQIAQVRKHARSPRLPDVCIFRHVYCVLCAELAFSIERLVRSFSEENECEFLRLSPMLVLHGNLI